MKKCHWHWTKILPTGWHWTNREKWVVIIIIVTKKKSCCIANRITVHFN